MKRMLVPAGVVLLAVLVAAAILPFAIDSETFRPLLQAQMQQRLQRRVSLGKIGWSLFPLGLRVEQVQIGEAPAFDAGRPFASAREARVRVGLLALLRREVSVESLLLREPVIELVRNRRGEWNYQSLGGTSGGGAALSFAALEIEDGKVALTDERARSPRAVYHHIDAALYDYAPNRAFRVELALRLPGAGKQAVALRGRGQPRPDAGLDFDGTLRLEQASLTALGKVSGEAVSFPAEAIASGDTTVRLQHPALDVEGRVALAQLQVRGRPFGEPILAKYKMRGDLEQNRWDLAALQLDVGGLKLSAAGRIDTGETTNLDLQVGARDAPIRGLAQLAYAFGAPRADFDVNGQLTAALRVRGAAARPSLEGSMVARELTVKASGWKQPVRVAALALEATPAAIRAREFAAETGGTRLAASFAVHGYSRGGATLEAALRAPQGRLDELLNIGAALGAVNPGAAKGTGQVALDVRVEGPLAGPLSASGSASLSQATIELAAFRVPVRIGSAQVNFDRDTARVEIGGATVGASTLRGNLALRDFANPQVTFRAAIDRLRSADAGEWLAETPAGLAAQPVRVTGSGALSIGELHLQQIVLTNVQTNCALEGGIIRLDPLTAEVYGGRHAGAVTIDTRAARTQYAVRSRLEAVDASQLLAALTAWKGALEGRLRMDTDVQFAPEPGQPPARSLNGAASFSMENGRLAGVDLLREIAALGKFLAFGGPSAGGTPVARLGGSLQIRDGVARTDDLRLELAGATLSGAGALNLADQSVDLRMTSVLSQEASARAGGSKIGGWLATAIANPKGELVIPLRISGVYPQLRYLPDAERLAELRLRGLTEPRGESAPAPPPAKTEPAPEAAAGEAATTPQPPASAPAPAAEPANPLRDLLDRLKTRRPKANEPQPQ
jgi:uncharacterized protein involved in outer membrane biogenesis